MASSEAQMEKLLLLGGNYADGALEIVSKIEARNEESIPLIASIPEVSSTMEKQDILAEEDVFAKEEDILAKDDILAKEDIPAKKDIPWSILNYVRITKIQPWENQDSSAPSPYDIIDAPYSSQPGMV